MVSKQEIKVTQDTFVVWLRRRTSTAVNNFPVKISNKKTARCDLFNRPYRLIFESLLIEFSFPNE